MLVLSCGVVIQVFPEKSSQRASQSELEIVEHKLLIISSLFTYFHLILREGRRHHDSLFTLIGGAALCQNVSINQ